MRRVLLSGYYGRQNTGDDALLAAATWGARRMFGADAQLAATAPVIPRFPGSAMVRPTSPPQRFRGEMRARRLWEAARAQSFLFGGGSVFHTADQLDNMSRLLALSGRGPHLAAGVSLGPFRSSGDERACARLLRKLRFVGLRDRESTRIAEALAPEVESRLTFDLAPLLTELAPADGPSATRAGIGVALCGDDGGWGDVEGDLRRRDRMEALLRHIGSAEKWVFIDFNGNTLRGDQHTHADLAARARALGLAARHVRYDDRPLEVLRVIGGLRVILAMRLHAAVFGYLASTPTLVLSYHPKCVGWAREVGIGPELVHDSALFDVGAVAEQVARALRGEIPAPSLPLAAAQARALLNFPPELSG